MIQKLRPHTSYWEEILLKILLKGFTSLIKKKKNRFKRHTQISLAHMYYYSNFFFFRLLKDFIGHFFPLRQF